MSAQKPTINAVFDMVYPVLKSSNLVPGTIKNGLIDTLNTLFQFPLTLSLTLSKVTYCKIKDGSKKSGKPDLSANWYVYYSYRNPITNKMDRFKIFRELNSYNTIAERQSYAKSLVIIYNELLRLGFNPFTEYGNEPKQFNKNIIKCADFYLAEKKHSISHRSYITYAPHIGYFTEWLKKNKLDYLNIDQITKSHIRQFISDYRDSSKAGNRHLNNIKDNVGLLFGYFCNNFDEVIKKNPVKTITDLPSVTQGNIAYSETQAAVLKSLMTEQNPYLLLFCETIYETCTRPYTETRRLKVGDFEFEQKRLHIRPELSKSGRSEYIPVSEKFMAKMLKYLADYPKDYYVFTRYRKPHPEKPLNAGTISDWYKLIKDEAGLDVRYSIYSWKHTYCVRAYLDTKDIFYIQIKCRHTDMATTCKYLRNLGLFVDLKKIADTVREL